MAQAAIPVKGTSQLHLGWLGLGVVVIAVALGAGLIGYYAGTSKAGPVNADQALLDQSTALWSGTYDAAKVAALYATDAVFVDKISDETSAGLPAIQAKISNYLTNYHFVTKTVAGPIRQGDMVVSVVKYGTNNDPSNTGLAVMQVKDGKIVRQTVYPVP
jgi:ketosteroid isomerase-like protein